jgi:hypothetical protein
MISISRLAGIVMCATALCTGSALAQFTPTPLPGQPSLTPTDTPTSTPVPPSLTPTDTPTNTPVPPSGTPSDTPTSTPPLTGTLVPTGTATPFPTITPFATPTPVDVPTGTTGSLFAFMALICAIAWLALRSTRTR